MKPKVSIIIVNYRVKEKLFSCIKSIYSSRVKIPFEIIVVDNDEKNTIGKELSSRFPEVIYVKNSVNSGFGAGNNLGAKYARGEHILFLNPDTLVFYDTIDKLYDRLKNYPKIGVVAPLLIDKEGRPFKRQGSRRLDIFNAILSLSFIEKVFPGFSKKFYLENWDKKTDREVDVVPGTCLMISSDLFKKINGFDESFFLYFEENDICNRVKQLGYSIYILSDSKIYHEVGASTKKITNTEKIFNKSRFLYFKKFYGIVWALMLETLLRLNKESLFVFFLLIFAFLLRIHNLSQNMVFIGDQGWFYLSARDMLLTGQIPLVGITSSHTWLHQGPLWTYMLSVVLFISKFNPVSGAYLTALFGVATVFLMYKLGSLMFSAKTGFIAAALYATSPLIIFSDRMPFDPSPIPFFVVLYLFALFKWVQGNVKYFPLTIFLLAILYNLELATFILFFPFSLFLIFGFVKNRHWAKNLLNKKIITISFAALIVPMLPVIVYDFSHGFKQTVVFLGWTFYKPFSFLLKNSSDGLIFNSDSVVNFLLNNFGKIIFQINIEIAILIFIASLIYLFYLNFKKIKFESAEFVLLFLLTISIVGILINQTPSDAYLPTLFPFLIFKIALFFEFFFKQKITKYFALFILIVLVLLNAYASLKNNYGLSLSQRLRTADVIINFTKNNEFNLIGKGPGSQFESFTMNYEYLLWWKGHPPSKSFQKTRIVIEETYNSILIKKFRR